MVRELVLNRQDLILIIPLIRAPVIRVEVYRLLRAVIGEQKEFTFMVINCIKRVIL